MKIKCPWGCVIEIKPSKRSHYPNRVVPYDDFGASSKGVQIVKKRELINHIRNWHIEFFGPSIKKNECECPVCRKMKVKKGWEHSSPTQSTRPTRNEEGADIGSYVLELLQDYEFIPKNGEKLSLREECLLNWLRTGYWEKNR